MPNLKILGGLAVLALVLGLATAPTRRPKETLTP